MVSPRTTTHKPKRMTLEEYLAGPPDELKSELVYGELVVSPSPNETHQDIEYFLEHLMRCWVAASDLGWVRHDLDMVLDEMKNLAYRPDLLFLGKENAHRRKQGRLFGPADLCVEILSPNDKPKDLRRKFSDYERYGVSWYWILDPDARTLEEYQLREDVFQCRSEIDAAAWFEPGLFPGLVFRLGPLLEGDLKAAVKGKARKLI